MRSAKFLVSDTLSLSNYPFSWLLILFLYVSSSLYQRQMYSQRVWCYSCHTTPHLLLLILMSLLTSQVTNIILLKKQQFVITHTTHHTEISALLRQLVYKHTFYKNVVFPKKTLVLTCLQKHNILQESVSFSVSHKTVYQWITTNCCFMSHILFLALTDHHENLHITHLM